LDALYEKFTAVDDEAAEDSPELPGLGRDSETSE